MQDAVAQIREIMTAWNFGPLTDRDALVAIFSVVGDDIQTSPIAKTHDQAEELWNKRPSGSDEKEHAAIVHQLRSRGWGRLDAIEEADKLMAERIERRAQGQAEELWNKRPSGSGDGKQH